MDFSNVKMCFFCSKLATYKVWFSYTGSGEYQKYREIVCDEHLESLKSESSPHDLSDYERIENASLD